MVQLTAVPLPAKTMWRGILIDMDGTLTDTLPPLYRVYQEFLNTFGIKGSLQEFYHLIGPSYQEILAYLQKKYQLSAPLPDLQKRYEGLLREVYLNHAKLFPGAMDCMQLLKKWKKQVVLVTSSSRFIVDLFLAANALESFFDHVITADGLQHSKPHPAIYQHALRAIGAKPHEVIAVEDSSSGVHAAGAAGISVIQLVKEQQPSPEACIHMNSWREIKALLRSHYA